MSQAGPNWVTGTGVLPMACLLRGEVIAVFISRPKADPGQALSLRAALLRDEPGALAEPVGEQDDAATGQAHPARGPVARGRGIRVLRASAAPARAQASAMLAGGHV